MKTVYNVHPKSYLAIKTFSYSDGPIENTILEILEDWSQKHYFIDLEAYLEKQINNWPTLYHFSVKRKNILRPVEINKRHSVLELGCGTGVLTYQLCKQAQYVVAVDGSPIRTACTRARCVAFDHLRVITTNFFNQSFDAELGKAKFDKIFLIGVLEYASVYAPFPNAAQKLIKKCRSFLKPSGQLVIGIENRLGLKYCIGYEEDHLMIPYYGVEDRYRKDDPTTYSKIELTALLQDCGFLKPKFYSVFPDYKFPEIIIQDVEPLSDSQIRLVQNVLYKLEAANYSGKPLHEIHFGRLLVSLSKNQLLSELANSFLVVADKIERIEKEKFPIMYYFANRQKFYTSEVVFIQNSDSSGIEVIKHWPNAREVQHTEVKLNQVEKAIEYVDGTNLQFLIYDGMVRREEQVLGLIQRWITYLVSNSQSLTLDMLPHNFLLTPSEELIGIDLDEWIVEQPLSVAQIVFRYFHLYEDVAEFLFKKFDLTPEIPSILEFFEIEAISANQRAYVLEVEQYFDDFVSGVSFQSLKDQLEKKAKLRFFVYRAFKFLRKGISKVEQQVYSSIFSQS